MVNIHGVPRLSPTGEHNICNIRKQITHCSPEVPTPEIQIAGGRHHENITCNKNENTYRHMYIYMYMKLFGLHFMIRHTARVDLHVNTWFPRRDSTISAMAPLTKPRCLSKFLVNRMIIPGLVRIRSCDLELGSHRYPSDRSAAVMPCRVSAASHTSEAPLFVDVSHIKALPDSKAMVKPRCTASVSSHVHCRSAKYSSSTCRSGCLDLMRFRNTR